MKRVLLRLVLLLAVLAALACAGAPGVAESALDFAVQDNGDVLVSWEAFGSEPAYEVRFTIAGGKIRWGDDESTDVHGTSYRIRDFVPGQTYTVTVENGTQYLEDTFTVPTQDFTGFKKDIGITLALRGKVGDETKKYKAFSVADLESGDGTVYGMRIEFTYPKLAKARSYKRSIVFKSPAGYAAYAHVSTWDMPAGEYYNYYTFYDMTYVFEALESDYGSIPTGTYQIEVYLDGAFAGAQSFEVEP